MRSAVLGEVGSEAVAMTHLQVARLHGHSLSALRTPAWEEVAPGSFAWPG